MWYFQAISRWLKIKHWSILVWKCPPQLVAVSRKLLQGLVALKQDGGLGLHRQLTAFKNKFKSRVTLETHKSVPSNHSPDGWMRHLILYQCSKHTAERQVRALQHSSLQLAVLNTLLGVSATQTHTALERQNYKLTNFSAIAFQVQYQCKVFYTWLTVLLQVWL